MTRENIAIKPMAARRSTEGSRQLNADSVATTMLFIVSIEGSRPVGLR
jgi:hypothetical protein